MEQIILQSYQIPKQQYQSLTIYSSTTGLPISLYLVSDTSKQMRQLQWVSAERSYHLATLTLLGWCSASNDSSFCIVRPVSTMSSTINTFCKVIHRATQINLNFNINTFRIFHNRYRDKNWDLESQQIQTAIAVSSNSISTYIRWCSTQVWLYVM